MIRHVIFLKFKTGTSESEIRILEDGFRNLPAAIPEIKFYEFGRDIVRSDRAFDFALVSAFDDLNSLRRYSAHHEHQKLLKHINSICDSIKSVDYEFNGNL